MKKLAFGALATILILVVAVYAHNGNGISRFSMHDEVEKVLESGTYSDLEESRIEYGMPLMHWIGNAEDFEFAKEYYKEPPPTWRFGGCH